MHPDTRVRKMRRSPFDRTVHRTETARRVHFRVWAIGGWSCAQRCTFAFRRKLESPGKMRISSRGVIGCGRATGNRVASPTTFHRDSGCVAGLFRAGVPPKVTHKSDRASVDYRSSHNKEVRTMRGTSFRHTARRRFSIACAPPRHAVYTNARVFF